MDSNSLVFKSIIDTTRISSLLKDFVAIQIARKWESIRCAYSRPRPAGRRSGENLKFLHVLRSINASRGGVCLVKVMSVPTKPMVDTHVPDAGLSVRVGVRVRAWHSIWVGECKYEHMSA